MKKIDPHVHLRDGEYEKDKETLSNGFRTAWASGLSGVFEMPNTNPPVIDEATFLRRIMAADKALAEEGISLFHGVIGGVTRNEAQVKEIIRLWRKYFPRLPGLKLFAGSSTGTLAVTGKKEQEKLYNILVREEFNGVLMVHCEKESLMDPGLFLPEKPRTHCMSRPPEAETESVRDQFELAAAAGFTGTVHICHISVPESVRIIEDFRKKSALKVTCGATPHHLLLPSGCMEKENGLLLKMNPPLRSEPDRKELFEMLLDERIDWIETDHAPHSLEDKLYGHASGIPVLQFYGSFIRTLGNRGFSKEILERLTFENIRRTFGIPEEVFPENSMDPGRSSGFYPFDPFRMPDAVIS